MSEDKKEQGTEAFLRRWSRLKQEDNQPKPAADEKPAAPLPPVDKLTPESDFTPFMNPKVEDALRRVALKKLFRDPHFGVPDPFEPFSGDWTGEPIPPEMLATLDQARKLLFSEEQKKKEEAEAADKPKPEEKQSGKQDA